jgi:hypothetical protein
MDAVDRRRQEVQAKLRGMIREAVRTKLGLLNEGNFVGNPVSREGRTLQVSVIDGQIKGTTASSAKGEVVIGMEIFDARDPNNLKIEERVEGYDAETIRKALALGDFTYPAADDILAARLSSFYTLVVRFGTFDTVRFEMQESVRLAVGFQFDSNTTATAPAAPAPADTAATTAAPAPAAAAAAAAPPTDTSFGSETPGGENADTATPQQASMSVQEKIRKGAQAIAGANYEDKVTDPIDIKTVAAQNAMTDHKWVENTPASRGKNLLDWSKGKGYDDKYTYYALVSDVTDLPVAFVVASDPEDNDHYSTGRFIGPNSRQLNLRKAFCVLYHRATGKVHESCDDGPTAGSEDDVPGGGRGRKGKGGAASGSDSKGEADGAGPGAKKINIRNGETKSGRGDVVKGLAGIKSAKEKLRQKGRVFITNSLTRAGFANFPKGNVELPAVLSIRVKFKHPMGIDSDANGYKSQVKFGDNEGPGDIVMIQLSGAWVTFWAAHPAKNKLKPGDKGFEAAAKWVFDNQKQFDLASEGTKIEDADSTGAAASAAVRPADNTGVAMTEGRRRPSLMDLYRF